MPFAVYPVFFVMLYDFFDSCKTKGVCVLTKNSPQLATPRRSLFSSNLFGHGSGRGKR
jgi:hypothetical protein